MMDLKYKLLALDMDGTFLAPDTSVPEANIKAINQAMDTGVEVIFCSGRCAAELKPYTDLFPRMKYAVCENGSYVINLTTGKYIDYRGLSREAADRIMEEATHHDVLIQMGANGKYYMQDWSLERLEEFGLEKYGDLMEETAEFVHDLVAFYHSFGDPVSKINFYCTNHEEKLQIISRLQEEQLPVDYVCGLADNIEMISTSAGKGVGLSALCKHLRLSPEKVMAVGDNNNDISMLKVAGWSVAMGNALPEVKAICDAETEDNAHDGVSKAIYRYILGCAEM